MADHPQHIGGQQGGSNYNAYNQPEPPTLPAGAGTGGGSSGLPAIPVDPTAAAQQQAAAKQSLKQWWTKFTKHQQQQQAAGHGKGDTSPTSSNYKGVFGVPLTESLKYAGVAISMVGPDGVNQVYGYIPIVVAKCGLFLKQKATTVEGVFRISGSTRRMKELQDIFDRPPSYGKDVVWGPWSVHDAANVLRRYLNQMPEPVVPGELYEEFRNSLPPLDKVHDEDAILASVGRYKALIASLPSSSKYLLCYVLDLLNVFARNHDTNLMPASNLAVVFQPGLIRGPDSLPHAPSHPIAGAISIADSANTINGGEHAAFSPPSFPQMSRSSSPSAPLMAHSGTADSGLSGPNSNAAELQRKQDEIKVDQEVLEFLINHQDHFVALPEGMSSSSAEASPVSPTSAGASAVGVGNRNGSHQQGQPSPTKQQQQQQTMPPRAQQAQQSQPPLQPPPAPFAQPRRQGSPGPSVPQQQQQRPHTASNAPPQPFYAQPPRQGSPGPSSASPQSLEPILTSRSQSVSHERSVPHPISTARAPPGPATATFPLQHQQPYSVPNTVGSSASLVAPVVAKSSSKDSKEREDKEHRQPRKLKKGRTPGHSGPSTPSAQPAPTAFWDPGNSQQQMPSIPSASSRGQSGSSGPHSPHQFAPTTPGLIYDDDVPLSATTIRPGSAGSGVKRSKTLPSPGGTRGASPRSVSSRRQSESRASSSPPLTPTGSGSPNLISIITTTASPGLLTASQPQPFDALPLSRSASAQTSYTTASSTASSFIAPPPVDLDSEYSEASGDESSRTGRKGWRKAFSRSVKSSDKEKEKAQSSAGSTRSESPARGPQSTTGSSAALSTSSAPRNIVEPKPDEKPAPSTSAGIVESTRRLSITQPDTAVRRKSNEEARPSTPLRESHVPPALGNVVTLAARRPSSSAPSSKKTATPTASAPVAIPAPRTPVSQAMATGTSTSGTSPSNGSPSTGLGVKTATRKSSIGGITKSPTSQHTVGSPHAQSHPGSPSEHSSGQLRAVKNPKPQGQEKEGGGSMSKREAKKAADELASKNANAIRNAVANMGR